MSKGLNLMSCQVPNFSLTSRRFFGLEQSRRGQKRTQKSNPRPRSSKPYFLILSLHSTKCWNITEEVSKGFVRDAVLWVTARQPTDIWRPGLCCTTHDFQTTFPDSLPITLPTYTIRHPKCNLQPKHKHGIDHNIVKPLPTYCLVLPCPA